MRFFSPPFSGCWQLRVVAASDQAADQREKLAVRDAVLGAARQGTPELFRAVAAARARGARACVRLYPPERPRPTLQVTLGAGKGRNWLGLLFPEAFGLPETGTVRFRWLILELLKGWGF